MTTTLLQGDVRALLAGLEPSSVSLCVTSPEQRDLNALQSTHLNRCPRDAENIRGRAAGLLDESPFSLANRPLSGEPLTVEDWEAVYLAHTAFVTQVRLIVDRARKRAAGRAPGCDAPGHKHVYICRDARP